MDVSEGTESTTEKQEEQRGSWRSSSTDSDHTIQETISEMEERYGIRTSLTDEQLTTLVRAYFDGKGDTEIAREIGDGSLDKTVYRARSALHLFRESDTQAAFDITTLRDCLENEHSGAECARQMGISKSTANRYRRILKLKDEANRIDHTYRDRLGRLCRDRSESESKLKPVAIEDDGLSDAVAGAGADNPQLQ